MASKRTEWKRISTRFIFCKYTAHDFKKKLKTEVSNKGLPTYLIEAANKQYEFWQRDPLAIHLFTKEVALQKLDYIHFNPLASHWQLVNNPIDYKYSTAKFYETEVSDFSFIKDLREEF